MAKKSVSANGNAVIIALIAAGLALASIFTQWGTASVTADDVSNHSDSILDQLGGLLAVGLTGGRIPIEGTSPLIIFGMKMPMWIISALVIAGACIAAANLARYAALPRLIPLILCGIGVAFSLYLLLSVLDGGIGIGALLLLSASCLGLFTSLKRA